MNINLLKKRWGAFTPYLLAGTSFVLFLYLIYILFYIIFLGALVGLLLLIASKINSFCSKRKQDNPPDPDYIDHKH